MHGFQSLGCEEHNVPKPIPGVALAAFCSGGREAHLVPRCSVLSFSTLKATLGASSLWLCTLFVALMISPTEKALPKWGAPNHTLTVCSLGPCLRREPLLPPHSQAGEFPDTGLSGGLRHTLQVVTIHPVTQASGFFPRVAVSRSESQNPSNLVLQCTF